VFAFAGEATTAIASILPLGWLRRNADEAADAAANVPVQRMLPGLEDIELDRAATIAANNAQQVRPRSVTPNGAGAMQLPDGRTTTGAHSVRGADPELNPEVQELLDNIRCDERAPGHGRCWETVDISRMRDADIDPAGAISDARRVEGPNSPRHNRPREACASCRVLFAFYDIIDGNAR